MTSKPLPLRRAPRRTDVMAVSMPVKRAIFARYAGFRRWTAQVAPLPVVLIASADLDVLRRSGASSSDTRAPEMIQVRARTLLFRASWVSSTLPRASKSGGTYMPKRPR